MVKVAVVQRPSAFLNKEECIRRVINGINDAADEGAGLVVFTETYIAGYPAWVWRLRPGGDWNTYEAIHQRLLESAVNFGSSDLEPIQQAAKDRNVIVVCGMEEKDDVLSQATLYNTVVVIGSKGEILNRHRKLMPTNPERMVWGFGDATGLRVVDTPVGRVGTLICWENYMPLARYALYSQNVQIYIAPTYDSGDGWIGTMQHIAREGRCYVIGSGNVIRGKDFPDDFPDKENVYPDSEEWVNPGDSVIIAPGGETVAGPMHKEEGILFAELEMAKVTTAKRALDVVGHYSRPDIFTLEVNNTPQSPVKFKQ